MKKEFDSCGYNGENDKGCSHDHHHSHNHHHDHSHDKHHHEHGHSHSHSHGHDHSHGHSHGHGLGMSPKSLIATGTLLIAFAGATRVFIPNDLESYRDNAIEQMITAEIDNQKHRQSVDIHFSEDEVKKKMTELFDVSQQTRSSGAATFAVLGLLAVSGGGIGLAVKSRNNKKQVNTPKPGV